MLSFSTQFPCFAFLAFPNDIRPGSSSGDVIYGLYNPVQSGVCSNSHISPTEVIVDGSHHPNNVEMTTDLSTVVADLSLREK